jgi:hypothetical protein
VVRVHALVVLVLVQLRVLALVVRVLALVVLVLVPVELVALAVLVLLVQVVHGPQVLALAMAPLVAAAVAEALVLVAVAITVLMVNVVRHVKSHVVVVVATWTSCSRSSARTTPLVMLQYQKVPSSSSAEYRHKNLRQN